MTSRIHEPNGSHYSARYAERKRAAERERDARPRQDPPCYVCGDLIPAAQMTNICAGCKAERKRIGDEKGLDAAEEWERNSPYARALRGES